MPKDVGNTAGLADDHYDGFAGRSDMDGKHILTIGVVAKMFKVSTLTLRFFEWRGLIQRRHISNEWVYSWSHCERIAVLVKARKADLTTGRLQPMLKGMDEQASKPVIDAGRLKCLSLIHELEDRQQAIGAVLGELYRIDWELSDRLGVEDSGGARPPTKLDC